MMKYGWILFALFSLNTGLKLRIRQRKLREAPVGFPAFPNVMGTMGEGDYPKGGWTPPDLPVWSLQDSRDQQLWLEFQGVCQQVFQGVQYPPENLSPMGGFTLIATMNYGLCFQAPSLSAFCNCRSVEIRNWDQQHTLEVFHTSFNVSSWKVMDGSKCDKYGFTEEGHSFSVGQEKIGDYFLKCDKAKKFETQLRKNWYTARTAWGEFYQGTGSFEKSALKAWGHEFVHFPVTVYLGLEQGPLAIDTPEELAAVAGKADGEFWCGGSVGQLCGPGKGQRDMDSVDVIFCPLGPNVALARDQAAALNSRHEVNEGVHTTGPHKGTNIVSGAPSAFWVMGRVPVHYDATRKTASEKLKKGMKLVWKMKGLGLEYSPARSLSATMLCQQWFDKPAGMIRNITGYVR